MVNIQFKIAVLKMNAREVELKFDLPCVKGL